MTDLNEKYQELLTYLFQVRDIYTNKVAPHVPKGNMDAMKLDTLFKLLQVQTQAVQESIQNVNTAITSRDDCIRALGEKLADVRAKNSEPFYVVEEDAQRKRGPSCGMRRARAASLMRVGEEQKWDKKRRKTYADELTREMARLSLAPMGLQGSEFERAKDELATSMRHETYNLGLSWEEMYKRSMQLIEMGEKKGVSRRKLRKFLRKKALTDDLIDKCFADYDGHMTGSGHATCSEFSSGQSDSSSDVEYSTHSVSSLMSSELAVESIKNEPSLPTSL